VFTVIPLVSRVSSILDRATGRKSPSSGLEKELKFPVIDLDSSGHCIRFRFLAQMEDGIKALGIASLK